MKYVSTGRKKSGMYNRVYALEKKKEKKERKLINE